MEEKNTRIEIFGDILAKVIQKKTRFENKTGVVNRALEEWTKFANFQPENGEKKPEVGFFELENELKQTKKELARAKEEYDNVFDNFMDTQNEVYALKQELDELKNCEPSALT